MKTRYIVAYDIRDPRRLQRVHYYLSRRAKALQKSVFLVECDGNALDTLVAGLRQRASDKVDDIRVYPIQHLDRLWAAGRQADKVRGLYAASASAPTRTVVGRVIGTLFGRSGS